jgi:hypothetical protein
MHVRWVHVNRGGSETNYTEEPRGVPTMRVETHGDEEWTFTRKITQHRMVSPQERPPRWELVDSKIFPRGKGWQWDCCLGHSDRWKRGRRA